MSSHLFHEVVAPPAAVLGHVVGHVADVNHGVDTAPRRLGLQVRQGGSVVGAHVAEEGDGGGGVPGQGPQGQQLRPALGGAHSVLVAVGGGQVWHLHRQHYGRLQGEVIRGGKL